MDIAVLAWLSPAVRRLRAGLGRVGSRRWPLAAFVRPLVRAPLRILALVLVVAVLATGMASLGRP